MSVLARSRLPKVAVPSMNSHVRRLLFLLLYHAQIVVSAVGREDVFSGK